MVGVFALAAAFRFRVKGNISGEVPQFQYTDLDISGGGEDGNHEVPECGAEGSSRAVRKMLKLVARKCLQFKCGASETEGPPPATEPRSHPCL